MLVSPKKEKFNFQKHQKFIDFNKMTLVESPKCLSSVSGSQQEFLSEKSLKLLVRENMSNESGQKRVDFDTFKREEENYQKEMDFTNFDTFCNQKGTELIPLGSFLCNKN